jgi:hypothetical protein
MIARSFRAVCFFMLSYVCQGIDVSSPAYLNYDPDEEGPPQEEHLLDWRLDPMESHSDWILQAVVPEGETTNYHVHKAVLCVGSRKSEFLETQLYQKHQQPADTTTSTTATRLTLHPLAAKAFSALLDYMYQKPLHITTDTATALHDLADQLEIKRLRWEARQFWQSDLDVTNYLLYYEHAAAFGDEKIQNAVAHLVASQLDQTTDIVKHASAQFWYQLLLVIKERAARDNNNSIEPELSLQLSNLTATVLERNYPVSADMFNKLTNEIFLPVIHPNVAVFCLQMERRIVFEKLVNEDGLSNLQTRCVAALATVWNDIRPSQDFWLHQSADLMFEYLTLSLQHAKHAMSVQDTSARAAQSELRQKQLELEHTLRQANERLAHYAHAERRIQHLERELERCQKDQVCKK